MTSNDRNGQLPEEKQRTTGDVTTPTCEAIPSYIAIKQRVIWLVGLVFLILCSPLIVCLFVLVRLTSPGPALYRQQRLGKNGKVFDVLKIRTMRKDAENEGAQLSKPGDARVTAVGRVLRALHLDELPQLINVARGEMCLVGPRPERPEIIAKNDLRRTVPGFTERTLVLPGITGLAQINLPADVTAACVIPKVQLDLEYIRSASLALDLRILLCTALRMVGIRHGRAVAWLSLGRPVDLSLLAVRGTAKKKKRRQRKRFAPGGAKKQVLAAMLGMTRTSPSSNGVATLDVELNGVHRNGKTPDSEASSDDGVDPRRPR
ncbi:sugar transferase [Pirellulales bacterium]|nr:sugar transferase [Pirellulales bacterium]